MTIDIRPPSPQEWPQLVRHSAEIAVGNDRDLAWFQARQHLVVTEDGVVVGHTSWTPCDGYVLWDETYVAPTHRKLGLGRRLMEARADRTPGLVFGACKPENEPMVHLLLSLGFHECQAIPHAYPDGGDALLWARPHPF